MEKINLLPICNTNKNPFFIFDEDKSDKKINNLVNKYIVFNITDDKGFTTLYGKLLKYEDGKLLVRKYDDGTEESKDNWTDYDGKDLFEDWEEYVSLNDIKSIEEYESPIIDFNKDCINKICDITNRNGEKITVLMLDYDGFEIEFKWKRNNQDNIVHSSFPLCLLNSINIVE